jgi:hypothetical protein
VGSNGGQPGVTAEPVFSDRDRSEPRPPSRPRGGGRLLVVALAAAGAFLAFSAAAHAAVGETAVAGDSAATAVAASTPAPAQAVGASATAVPAREPLVSPRYHAKIADTGAETGPRACRRSVRRRYLSCRRRFGSRKPSRAARSRGSAQRAGSRAGRRAAGPRPTRHEAFAGSLASPCGAPAADVVSGRTFAVSIAADDIPEFTKNRSPLEYQNSWSQDGDAPSETGCCSSPNQEPDPRLDHAPDTPTERAIERDISRGSARAGSP